MNEHAMTPQYKTYNAVRQSSAHINRQHGVVLFFALIALVVMSLAAVALIRSVDTNTIIAGNLTTKQSATVSADSGLETALGWMDMVVNPATLEVDNAAQGYYATEVANPTTDFNWDDSDSRPATGYGITAGTDGSGNAIRYIVQRMCRSAGAPADDSCLFGAPVVGASSQAVRAAPLAGGNVTTEKSPLYRVTARVTSVKDTVSYIQAFVY